MLIRCSELRRSAVPVSRRRGGSKTGPSVVAELAEAKPFATSHSLPARTCLLISPGILKFDGNGLLPDVAVSMEFRPTMNNTTQA